MLIVGLKMGLGHQFRNVVRKNEILSLQQVIGGKLNASALTAS